MEQVPPNPGPTESGAVNTSNASSQARGQPRYAWAWHAAFGVLSVVAIILLYGVGAYPCVPLGGVGKVESVRSVAEFDALIGKWVHEPTCVRSAIIDQLASGISRDDKAILFYGAALFLGCVLAATVFWNEARRKSGLLRALGYLLGMVAGVLALGVVVAGWLDWRENRALAAAFDLLRQGAADADAPFRLAAESARIKFIILGAAVAAALGGAALWRPRRSPQPEDTANPPQGTLPTLADFLKEEWGAIAARRAYIARPAKTTNDGTHPRGLFGLALSGGGIRSATFSLGMLQGLARAGLIQRIDYLSTVSGGGFTGGWWSAWLSREAPDPDVNAPTLNVFPDPEQLGPARYPPRVLRAKTLAGGERWRTTKTAEPIPEGSLSVTQGDPIHHLRLFANYLTPRKGFLSADTWRAITVVTRNLILTWLVLLPVLFAAVLLPQLYFAASHEHGFGFVCSLPDTVRADSIVTRARGSTTRDTSTTEVFRATAKDAAVPVRRSVLACAKAPQANAMMAHATVLKTRAQALVAPLGALFAVSIALTLLWMLSTEGGVRLTLIGVGALLLGGVLLIRAFAVAQAGGPPGFWSHFLDDRLTQLWFGGALLAILAASLYTWYARRAEPPIAADRVRNRLVHYHAIVNVLLAIGAALLLIGGFGHEIAWWFTDPDRGLIARAGGWSAVLVSIGTAVYTTLRASPSPKDERPERPNVVSRAIFAIAPFLVLVVLAVLLAWLGNWLMGFGSTREFGTAIGVVVVIGVVLEILLAINELWERLGATSDDRKRIQLLGILLVVAALVVGAAAAVTLGWWRVPMVNRMYALTAITLAFALILFRAITTREQVRGDGEGPMRVRGSAEPRLPEESADKRKRTGRLVTVAVLLTLAAIGIAYSMHLFLSRPGGPRPFDGPATFAMGIIVFIVILVILEMWLGTGDSDRTIGLAAVAAASCAMLVILRLADDSVAYPQTAFAQAGYELIASALALVIAFGWAIDPNLVSLHTFYRARLVRAYLGASNPRRITQDITEAAPGDDIPLSKVANHKRGGPYHLVNTTLNLAGGRDLATAQRSAENFVLSSLHCGSARTGYRSTTEYMDNGMTLGMAVAISGAAVSPNMGSATPSAALAMLLALFNARIGFWAPTPDRHRFRERHPRLWPVYLLRESLSQTNDLGTYCYLTDGGHFDNTALYALIERGCSTIVVVDDGADPTPCFGDMGQAIRRCRIDFGTEFCLQVDAFLPPAKDEEREDIGKKDNVHVVKGTIRYSDAHLEQLGYGPGEMASARTGTIYWIKPVVRPGDTVDVRQYKLQNGAFPQQTTADQWYDEGQFVSYRQLGALSAAALVEAIAAPNVTRDDGVNARAAPDDARTEPPDHSRVEGDR